MLKKAVNFLKTDIWRIQLGNQPKIQSFFIKQLRIVLVAFRGFNEDKCMLRASALTFYSLLSIVPVMAMLFGIAKGFGLERKLQERIMDIEGYNQEVLLQVSQYAQSMLEDTKGGLVAGIGVAILFWSVMKVLGNIEVSFNDIWEIKKQRSIARKFTDYLSIMMIAPILFIVSTSITGYVMDQVKQITESVEFLGFFSPVIFFLLKFLPYVLVWLLLAFMYLVMPNTKVNFKSAFVAGIIAGTIFQVVEVIYFSFQFGVGKYNAIYGSLAALPLFLVWLQTSWMIVLFGAEVSFANQNVYKYEFEADSRHISVAFKRKLSILIMHVIVKRFQNGEKAEGAMEIAERLSIPIRIVRQIIFELIECEMVVELKNEDKEGDTYQPGIDISGLTIQGLMLALDKRGSSNIPIQENDAIHKIKDALIAFENSIKKSTSNILIKDI